MHEAQEALGKTERPPPIRAADIAELFSYRESLGQIQSSRLTRGGGPLEPAFDSRARGRDGEVRVGGGDHGRL
jgi:hypothetical protein